MTTEHLDKFGQVLRDVPQPVRRPFARLGEQCIEGATELLEVASKIVLLDRCRLGCVSGVVDLVDPALDAVGALLVQHVRGADRVAAEDRRQRGVALGLRQVGQLVLQLPGQVSDANKIPGGIVGGDAQLFHFGLGFGGRVRHPEQHRFEAGAGVGADQAGRRERRQGAGCFFDRQAELRRDKAGLLERHRHVGDFALGFAGSGGDQVSDVRDVRAGQAELGHGGGRHLGAVGHTKVAGCGEG